MARRRVFAKWISLELLLTTSLELHRASGCHGSLTADQVQHARGHVALIGSALQLWCSHATAAEDSAHGCHETCSSRPKMFAYKGSNAVMKMLANDSSAGHTSVSIMPHNTTHTYLTLHNVTAYFSGYYSCYCQVSHDQHNSSLHLLGTLILTLAYTPQPPSDLCCAVIDNICSFSFHQDVRDAVPGILSTQWKVCYVETGDMGAESCETTSCSGRTCNIALSTHFYTQYTFKVTGTNLLGNWSGSTNIFINDSAVRPGQVAHVKIVPVNSSALKVQWQAFEDGYASRFRTKFDRHGFEYKVAYWSMVDPQLVQIMKHSSHDLRTAIIMTGLLPGTEYQVQISSRIRGSTYDCTWSNAIGIKGVTFTLPQFQPVTFQNGFFISPSELSEDEDCRNITIFWQSSLDGILHPDGTVDNYIVTWSPHHSITLAASSRQATAFLCNNTSYNVTVAARSNNTLFKTSIAQAIFVPAKPEILSLQACQLSAEALNATAAQLSWKSRETGEHDLSYTVFWCLDDGDAGCMDDISSQLTDVDATSLIFNVGDLVYKYRVGLSAADVDGRSSGIVWAHCLNNESGVLPEALRPPVLRPSGTSNNGSSIVEIRYSPACAIGSPKASEYKIAFCKGVESCQGETKSAVIARCSSSLSMFLESDGENSLFWLQASFGNRSVSSPAISFRPASTGLSYYWVILLVAVLTAGMACLIFFLYRLIASLKDVKAISHIPRTTVDGSEDCSETGPFLAQSSKGYTTNLSLSGIAKSDTHVLCASRDFTSEIKRPGSNCARLTLGCTLIEVTQNGMSTKGQLSSDVVMRRCNHLQDESCSSSADPNPGCSCRCCTESVDSGIDCTRTTCTDNGTLRIEGYFQSAGSSRRCNIVRLHSRGSSLSGTSTNGNLPTCSLRAITEAAKAVPPADLAAAATGVIEQTEQLAVVSRCNCHAGTCAAAGTGQSSYSCCSVTGLAVIGGTAAVIGSCLDYALTEEQQQRYCAVREEGTGTLCNLQEYILESGAWTECSDNPLLTESSIDLNSLLAMEEPTRTLT